MPKKINKPAILSLLFVNHQQKKTPRRAMRSQLYLSNERADRHDRQADRLTQRETIVTGRPQRLQMPLV